MVIYYSIVTKENYFKKTNISTLKKGKKEE